MGLVQIDERVPYRGRIRAWVFDGDLSSENQQDLAGFVDEQADAQCVSYCETDNMVLNTGRQQMTKLIMGETAALCGYIGLTTSATTPSLALAALTDEIDRNATSVAASYNSYYQRRIAYFSTVDFNSTGIAGAGAFDTASTGGNMWLAASISLSKTNVQGAIIEWQVNASS